MKKLFATIITIVITLCVTMTVVADTEYVCGDTTNDGVVDVSDAVIIKRYAVQDIPYLPWNKQIRESGEPIPWEYADAVCGDVNADGEVTIVDAVIIERYVAKTISELPYLGAVEIEESECVEVVIEEIIEE